MRKVLIVFLFLNFTYCRSPERSKDVMTESQLTALLIDIYLAEARTDNIRVKNLNVVKDSSIRYFLPFEKELLKKHGVSDSIIKITYTYYLAHPKDLEKVYDAVIDTLSLREKRAIHTPEPKFVPVNPVRH